MELRLHWHSPVILKEDVSNGMIYHFDFSKLPDCGGVYLFGRSWGNQFEALYVGKAKNVRSRTKGHMNNVRLMNHLKQAANGKRVVLAGEFDPRPGQQRDKCLKILERGLIRHFLSEGHDLVNVQGVKIRTHSISSSGGHRKKWWPTEIHVEQS